MPQLSKSEKCARCRETGQVWWAARMARYLYQVPRGLDTRLVTWSDDRQADWLAKYEHYVRLAKAVYS